MSEPTPEQVIREALAQAKDSFIAGTWEKYECKVAVNGKALESVLAALDVLVAERDDARRDWQMYVHEVSDEKARADAAERRAGLGDGGVTAPLGWHVISGEQLLEMLGRVAAGEDPDLVYAEEYANADRETVEGDS